jgi:hypothetical protein
MTAPLSICTKEKRSDVVRLFSAESDKGVEIHVRLFAQYEENALTRRNIYEWINMFKKGRTRGTDSESSGRPSITTNEGKQEHATTIIPKDRRIAVRILYQH